MCKVFNSVGSLTSIKAHLKHHNIHDFKSLKEVMDFQNSYTINRKDILETHEQLIEQEMAQLQSQLLQLNEVIADKNLQLEFEFNKELELLRQNVNSLSTYIPANIFQQLAGTIKKGYYKTKLYYKEKTLHIRLKYALKKLAADEQKKSQRYHYLLANTEEAVRISSSTPLAELDRKKKIIDEVQSLIYGALGEQKVVKQLESLSDEYYLINDFNVSFSSAIYNNNDNSYIKSVQIDHLLISPSGIFIIETKNWSATSLKNLNLRSPVEQIKRAGYVLYKLLHDGIANNVLYLNKHHWGNKKIPLRNLIVLTNSKPKEEFQYVKTLTLNELLSYINYFKPIFSNSEAQRITDYLLKINNKVL